MTASGARTSHPCLRGMSAATTAARSTGIEASTNRAATMPTSATTMSQVSSRCAELRLRASGSVRRACLGGRHYRCPNSRTCGAAGRVIEISFMP